MDVYILGKDFMDKLVVNEYVSFIWSERYAEYGDFKLELPSANKDLLSKIDLGDYVRIPNSTRRMIIQSIEIDETESDDSVALITGRSLEAALMDRVVMPLSGTIGSTVWDFSEPFNGVPSSLASSYFHLGQGGSPAGQPEDNFRVVAGGYPGLDEQNVTIDWEFGNSYDLITKTLAISGLGFCFRRTRAGHEYYDYYFDIFRGVDRSLNQTEVAPVIFSSALETFESERYLESNTSEKNVAYVYSKFNESVGFTIEKVYDPPAAANYTGPERKVMLVDAQDIYDQHGYSRKAYYDLGLKALRQSKKISQYDGVVPNNSLYRYGTDFDMGDIVSVQGKSGKPSTKMKVVEYIWSSDSNGEVEYPTFETVEPE